MPARATAWFVTLSSVYGLALVAVRLGLPGALEHDEAEQALLTQSLAWGYTLQPPLYTWLQHGLFSLLGVGVPALALLKATLLTATYVFAFLAGRLVLGAARPAMVAAFALALLPQIGWEAQRDLTHSVLATCLAAGTLHALARILRGGRTWDYAWLGILLGLGVLAKYNFLIFAAALLGAAGSLPEFRSRVFDRRLTLTATVATVVAMPHVAWLVSHLMVGPAPPSDPALPGPAVGRYGVVGGLADLAWTSLRSTLPIVAAVALCFPATFRARRRAAPDAYRRLLDRFWFLAGIGLATAVLVAGLTFVKSRWLAPFLVPLPLYAFLRVRAVEPGAERPRVFAALVAAVLALGLLVRLGMAWVGPHIGVYTRLHVPFAALAGEIRRAGLQPATILAEDRVTGGNLRVHFPEARVLATDLPSGVIPPPARPGACLVVWRGPGVRLPVVLERALSPRLGIAPGPLPEPWHVEAPRTGGSAPPRDALAILWLTESPPACAVARGTTRMGSPTPSEGR